MALPEKINVTINYLAQETRPRAAPPPRPAAKTALLRTQKPPLHYYRYLFDVIGAPWHWVSRRYMDDQALQDIIHDPDVYLYILHYNGAPCGMGEIDARKEKAGHAPGDIELKFFGLIPEVTGTGLGRWFLYNVIDLAWTLNPARLILETCSADHPAALPLYQKMGFSVYDRGTGVIEWKG